MRALVTGAAGFIGGALAGALLEAGWHVNLLVRPGSRNKLLDKRKWAGATVFEADLSRPGSTGDQEHLRRAASGCDVVFHAAAIRNRWGTTLESYRLTNVEGTRRLLEAAAGQARRFVYISSVGVFGYPGVLDIDESFPVIASTGKAGYHNSKAEAERLVTACNEEFESVIVRPTITYGPGDGDGMVTRLIDLIAGGRYVQVGPGENHVHLTYIDDLLQGLFLAGTHPAASGQVFILAGPHSIAVGELVAMIAGRLGRTVPDLPIPENLARGAACVVEMVYRTGAALRVKPFQSAPPLTRDKINTMCIHRGYSSLKAAHMLGYQPRVGYAEGIDKTLACRGTFAGEES